MKIDTFSERELTRYSRNFLVKNWGLQKQLQLKNSTVLIALHNEYLLRILLCTGVGSIYSKQNSYTDKNLRKLALLNSDVLVASERDLKPTKNLDVHILDKRDGQIQESRSNHKAKMTVSLSNTSIELERDHKPIEIVGLSRTELASELSIATLLGLMTIKHLLEPSEPLVAKK